jgi:hypothetical protein
MTLFDVEELTQYWMDHPPTHLMIAAHLGAGNGRRSSYTGICSGRGGIQQVLTELGPAFTSGDVHVGLRPAVLDFSKLRQMNQSLPD